jgi:hypothetical protein
VKRLCFTTNNIHDLIGWFDLTINPFCPSGKSGWPLPVVEIEMPKGLDRFKWFAVFLLDGSICPKLSKYVTSLLSTPTTMVKSWAR